MLATISPANIHIDETLATLRYACQARRIVNRVKVNESENDKIIRELRSEVNRLKALQYEFENRKQISDGKPVFEEKCLTQNSSSNRFEAEITNLREQLAEREKELHQAQKSWKKRLHEADDLRKAELQILKQNGLALEFTKDQKQAYLVNLTEDPILSGTLFYLLPPGIVKIGRRRSRLCIQPDIALDGPMIAHNHCMIENKEEKLYITPENQDFETYLNGDLVTDRKLIMHGDRLVLGGSHFFRVANPFCTNSDSRKLFDYRLAYEEILEKKEEKLRMEFENEKLAALLRLESERVQNEQHLKDKIEQLQLEKIVLKYNNEILQSEQKVLKDKTKELNFSNNSTDVKATFWRNSFLKQINNIMQKPSKHNLHKTQLMIKEAVQICQNNNLNYDFKQNQIIDEFGIFHTKIMVFNLDHSLMTIWPVARLEVWLEYIRTLSSLNADNVFDCVDIDWEPYNNKFNESFNFSSDSNEVVLEDQFDSGKMTKDNLEKNHNCEKRKEIDFRDLALSHIQDINIGVTHLQEVCDQFLTIDSESCENVKTENIISNLENLLHSLNKIQLSLRKNKGRNIDSN